MAEVIVGVVACKSKPFLTKRRKTLIKKKYDVSMHSFIERITTLNMENFKDYLREVKGYARPEGEDFAMPTDVPALQPFLKATRRFCIIFISMCLDKKELQNEVQQLQALKIGNTIDAAGLLCAANWGLLDAITKYNALKSPDYKFSSVVFSRIRWYIRRYLDDQTGEHLEGSFLGAKFREDYYRKKLLSLQ